MAPDTATPLDPSDPTGPPDPAGSPDAADPPACVDIPLKGEPQFAQNRTLFWMVVAVSLGLLWILLPFYGPIMWSAIIALLFAPLNQWLLKHLKREANAAAVLTLLVAVVVAIFPLAVLITELAADALSVYARLESGDLNPGPFFHAIYDALPRWAKQLLARLGLKNFSALERQFLELAAVASQHLAAQALDIGMLAFDYVIGFFVTLYLAFFLLRDGRVLARALHDAAPLAPAYKYQLRNKFTTVVRATVKGNLVIAALQGALGGVAFWVLGVSSPLLWAVLMAFLSLLPAVGAGLVWVPVAIYFFATGALWQSMALTLFGVLVIGLVDNVLRPALVGKDTRLPDYLVMITTLGGMAAIGINGFVLGPVIAALFVAVWHIHGTTRTDAP
jgi:predicted PurR-regulated permease PerM